MMETNSKVNYSSVDDYFATLPEKTQALMREFRSVIQRNVPEAESVISYNMPAFKYLGVLVYYAAYNKHIGFYPADLTVLDVFKEDLVGYKTSKGTIQFPLDQEIPFSLIEKIIRYRKERNEEKARIKKLNKKSC